MSKEDEYKYVNPKIKDTLDIKGFYKSEEIINAVNMIQAQTNLELDKIIRGLSFTYPNSKKGELEAQNKFLNNLLNKFIVERKSTRTFGRNKDKPEFSDSFPLNDEDSSIPQFGEYRNGEQSLVHFLQQERNSIANGIH